tara:strand:+ start:403 stop:963 length:561 start_codon:yes stop_codon:yes gene_type:complete
MESQELKTFAVYYQTRKSQYSAKAKRVRIVEAASAINAIIRVQCSIAGEEESLDSFGYEAKELNEGAVKMARQHGEEGALIFYAFIKCSAACGIGRLSDVARRVGEMNPRFAVLFVNGKVQMTDWYWNSISGWEMRIHMTISGISRMDGVVAQNARFRLDKEILKFKAEIEAVAMEWLQRSAQSCG